MARSAESSGDAPRAPGPWQQALRRLLANRAAVAGLAFVALVSLLAFAAPLVTWHAPDAQYHDHLHEGPSWAFPLGTDALGKDLYTRLVYGARVSLAVGIVAQATAMALGLLVGATAALGGRRADSALMRATDVAFAFPDLLMVILIASLYGASFLLVVLAIGLVSWPAVARLVRGQMLSLQHEEFVVAAQALGATRPHIALRHLLPNALGPLIVTATFGIPAAIFAEAALAFVGLGLASGSWGQLVFEGKAYAQSAPHLLLFPCLTVALTMMSFTFIGDGLRDALDPRTSVGRGRSRLADPATSEGSGRTRIAKAA